MHLILTKYRSVAIVHQCTTTITMAMHLVGFLLLLTASMSISTLAATEASDEAALLAFKAAAISGTYHDPLASWNSSSDGGFCSWEGVMCGARHRRVVALSLTSYGLTGVLSPAIGNLSFLRFLNLSNNGLSGDIPASLGRLRRLHAIDLSNNAFSGEVPVNLSSCTSLTIMILSFNQLHGHVPLELGDKLARLRVLNLQNNSLTGFIPASLANLSSLIILSLAFNHLEGIIPPGLGGIVGLQKLHLGYNHLSGEPPHSLYNLSSLQWLKLQLNNFHGSIPADIGSRFPSMLVLNFAANQFTGSIPSSLSNLTTLQQLILAQNRLSGYVPHTLGNLRALKALYLLDNMLEAKDSAGWEFITSLSNCSKLQELDISENTALTGQMPSSIVNLSTNLQILTMYETGLSGSIPSAISNLVSLASLGLSNTAISGVIPDSIGKLGNLVQLYSYNTELSGLIPSSIGNLSKLTILSAFNSNLEGPIPASLGNLKSLLALYLNMNCLNGSIPREIFKLPLLSISILDLSHNSLFGTLPFEFGRLQNLNSLYLSGNQFSGQIPNGIEECTVLQDLWLDNNSFEGSIPQSLNNIKGLTTLNLSMNKLSGAIPDAIGSIHNLQLLYIANNNLSGTIPAVLQNLTSLLELDISFNNLQGEVPKEGIFSNLANLSIIGNNELCGGLPQLHLAPCHKNYMKNRILATIGGLLFLALVCALTHFIYKKFGRKKNNSFLTPIIEDHYERVSYDALANGTDGFSEANLLGKGSFGDVYKCNFQAERTIVAVKVFKLEQSGSARSFMAECEALRRVRHRCLIKIITCCSSIDHQGQEFKALIFEFMPNGSLDGWLHPKSDKPTQRNTLSLQQRLDIAVDIVDALDYLHNQCQPPIIHCDLKPSNILLTEDMSARVGDFGISRILADTASKTQPNSNSTVGIRGSVGYVAPEYGEGSTVSTSGDVYSLGILLLEMFTGRSPTDDIFRDSLDLHMFAKSALSEGTWDIADPAIWLHVESKDGTTSSRVKDCLVSVLGLAISCSKLHPRDRITMREVSGEMHAIRDSYLIFSC
ncbi:hypothetical protein ACP70R_030482 [Stipagrostis hirtigluma subsp. patula]